MADEVEARVPQMDFQRGCPRTFIAMASKVAEFTKLRQVRRGAAFDFCGKVGKFDEESSEKQRKREEAEF